VDARRRRRFGTIAIAALLSLGLVAAALAGAFSGPSPAQIAFERARAEQQAALGRAEALVAVKIPTRQGEPAPLPGGALFRRAHRPPLEVIGYVPYWTMDELTAADFQDVSTLCYYGPVLGPSGSLVTQGPGWTALSSATFARLVEQAHNAGDRVLLTVSATSPASIAALLSRPQAHGARLADELIGLLAAYHLDGVSLDIEGRASAERQAFVSFVASVAAHLRGDDPGAELIVDTYPQSASSTDDFFDVAAIARHVERIFIMGYDMEDPTQASAGAPLASPTLGLSDTQAVLAYSKLVPAKKVVLGVPFYGYDFTLRPTRHDGQLVEDPPVAVTYASIVRAGRLALWDPSSLTPYTSFRAKGLLHKTFYDDPVSIALKTALAKTEGLGGTGAWALGDEGTSTAMLAALDGGQPPLKQPLLPGPSPAAAERARRTFAATSSEVTPSERKASRPASA
jgi:hypothetical protein